ncbi:hypothetical protein QMK28_31645, partial [Streptomyces sp. H27-D2]|nr:hypothetical protein [Streptomyces sp. H27-D2]
DRTLARTPVALLPPLLLDEDQPRRDGPRVRFARRLLPGVLTSGRLSAVAGHVFARGHVLCQASAGCGGAVPGPTGSPDPTGLGPAGRREWGREAEL